MEKDPSLSQMDVGVLMSFCIFVVVSLREVRLFLKDLLYGWIIWIMFMCCAALSMNIISISFLAYPLRKCGA